MTLSVTYTPMIFSSQLGFTELPVTAYDPTPDLLIELQVYSQGFSTSHKMICKTGDTFKISKATFPPFVTFLGQKHDETAAYIALNVDLENAVVFNLYAVTEQPGGGASGDDFRVAGKVQINKVAAQRDVLIISDDPGGREIVGQGASESDGTFDLTYTGWDGPVIVVALDKYGVAFSASKPLNASTVIHPTTPNGYVYVVTEAGVTGTSEPAWSTTGTVVSGSVTFAPRPYYRPVASGPLQGEQVE